MYQERNQSLKAAVLRGKRNRFEEFWALRDVSLEVEKGSTHGLIGENGSGKSTLLKCIARIYGPDQGTVTTTGSIAALLELGSGFHPELSGRDNIYLNGAILGMRKSEIEAKMSHIIDFSGVGPFIDQPVKTYSSGMYVRLGFSIAINVNPDILLVDEVLAVGDENFQDKCMDKFADYRRRGKTVILVSHGMSVMRSMCDAITWLEHGGVVESGGAAALVDGYVDRAHHEIDLNDPDAVGGPLGRWGSGEVQITKISVLDGTSAPVSSVRTGDAVTFQMEYEATERVPEPRFGLAMKTVDGVVVWQNNSTFGDYRVPSILGHGVARFAVPRLMLQPGGYYLSAAVSDSTTTHFYDFIRDGLRFDVLIGSPREHGGIVTLGGEWSGSD